MSRHGSYRSTHAHRAPDALGEESSGTQQTHVRAVECLSLFTFRDPRSAAIHRCLLVNGHPSFQLRWYLPFTGELDSPVNRIGNPLAGGEIRQFPVRSEFLPSVSSTAGTMILGDFVKSQEESESHTVICVNGN